MSPLICYNQSNSNQKNRHPNRRRKAQTRYMYEKTTFPNGLRLLTSSMPQTRSVSISFYFGAGSRYETPAQAGISHFLEHILFKGTVKRPRPEDVSGAI